MHTVFAIEPDVMNSYINMRYLIEKFGYDKGLLIAQYPKQWLKEVYDASNYNSASPLEKKQIEAILSTVKFNCSVKLGIPYSPDNTWLDNTLNIEDSCPGCIDGKIIISKASNQILENVIAFEEIDGNIFENHRDKKIKMNAHDLALAAKYLIRNEDEIFIIDPYFQVNKNYTEVIKEFVKTIRASFNKKLKFNIYCNFDKFIPSNDNNKITDNFYKYLTEYNCNLVINLLSDETGSGDLHARYLLTSKGGLRYDRGFSQPQDIDKRHKETDVSCLDNKTCLDIKKMYTNSDCFTLKDNIIMP